ncbi:MAG: hypothetical protein RJB42_1559 [Bacteroidota bacterium]
MMYERTSDWQLAIFSEQNVSDNEMKTEQSYHLS